MADSLIFYCAAGAIISMQVPLWNIAYKLGDILEELRKKNKDGNNG